MNKADKLKKLDEAVLDKMLEWIETDQTDRLPELGNAINFLKANQVVEDKQKKESDPMEVRKQKLKDAKERREQV